MMSIDTDRFRTELLKERERVQSAIENLRESHPGTIDDETEEITGTSGEALNTIDPTADGFSYFDSVEGSNSTPAFGFSKFSVTKNEIRGEFVRAAVDQVRVWTQGSLLFDWKRRFSLEF